MKKMLLKKLLVAVAAFAALVNVQALDQTSANYIGYINPDHPANPASEVDYINKLIALAQGQTPAAQTVYDGQTIVRDGAYAGPTPTALLLGSSKDDTTPSTTVDVTGFTYLLGKYDAAGAGALVFYVGNLTGNQTIPGTFSGNGLSHWSLYNSTGGGGGDLPEGGATIALLGLGLTGVGLLRSRISRK